MDLPFRDMAVNMLCLLKAKGVPVIGYFAPKLDPSYKYKSWYDVGRLESVIEWAKISD